MTRAEKEFPGLTEPSVDPDPRQDQLEARADWPRNAAVGFLILSYFPVGFYETVLGYGRFGPIAWPTIVAMVAVLFGVITGLRGLDRKDSFQKKVGLGVVLLALLRIFFILA